MMTRETYPQGCARWSQHTRSKKPMKLPVAFGSGSLSVWR